MSFSFPFAPSLTVGLLPRDLPQQPDIHAYGLGIVQQRLTFWLLDPQRLNHSRFKSIESRASQWPWLMKDTRAIELIMMVRIKAVALGQEELERTRSRPRQRLANRPSCVELSWRATTIGPL